MGWGWGFSCLGCVYYVCDMLCLVIWARERANGHVKYDYDDKISRASEGEWTFVMFGSGILEGLLLIAIIGR